MGKRGRFMLISVVVGLGVPLAAQATPVITDGLVAAYEFSGNSVDLSGNGYDAVNHGAVLAEDRFGQTDSAYRFNGHQYLSVDGFTSLDSYTISGWVNWDSVSGWRPFVDDTDGAGNVRFEISNNRLSLSDHFSETLTIEAGQWYQIAVSYNHASQEVAFYFNGQAAGTTAWSGAALDEYFEMGRGLYGWDEYLKGYMDDVYFYDRVLTSGEIGRLYSASPVPEPGTMLLFGTGLGALLALKQRRALR